MYSEGVGSGRDVTIVRMYGNNRLDTQDDDVFEKNIKWENLREDYKQFFEKIQNGEDFVFSKTEEIVHFFIDDSLPVENNSRILIHNIEGGDDDAFYESL